MKPTSADSESESSEASWPSVLQIGAGEFQQCFAVAQLAVKLCEIKMAQSKVPLERENADPKNFLAKAWELIQSAREHTLRPQTGVEYLVENNMSGYPGPNTEALAKVIGRMQEPNVPFRKLCDATRNKGDTEIIHGVRWKV